MYSLNNNDQLPVDGAGFADSLYLNDNHYYYTGKDHLFDDHGKNNAGGESHLDNLVSFLNEHENSTSLYKNLNDYYVARNAIERPNQHNFHSDSCYSYATTPIANDSHLFPPAQPFGTDTFENHDLFNDNESDDDTDATFLVSGSGSGSGSVSASTTTDSTANHFDITPDSSPSTLVGSQPFHLMPSATAAVSAAVSAAAAVAPTNHITKYHFKTHNGQLASHRNVVLPTKNSEKIKYMCSVCGKGFKRPSSLSTHMNIHTGVKPFFCPFHDCKKSFNAKSNMLRHYKLHFKLSSGNYILPNGEITTKKPTTKQLFERSNSCSL